MRARATARETILDAAERVVAERGVKQLTIDGVARAAGVSKGGIFYHFPSKEALVQGMVARLVERFQQALDQTVAQDADPHGRLTRAYARLVLGGDQETGAVMAALLAALAHDPHILDPFHERLQLWQRQSEAELDPTVAAIVRLTTHALWTNGLFLTNTFTSEQVRLIVDRLEQLTRAPEPG